MTHLENLAERRTSAAPDALDQRTPVAVLGVPFEPLAAGEAIARIREMLARPQAQQVVIANAHTLNLAYEDPAYREALCRAALILRDGVGIELASRLLGKHLDYNFVGTDFVPLMLASLALPRVRVFLFGAAPGVAVAAGEALRRFSPSIVVVGCEDGYGDFETVVARLDKAGTDVLLVALGNPKQEEWIAANLARLNARVAIGVGALFDFLAGRVPRAPRWVRRMRFEWLYRLWLEPRRLWRRYLVGNARFLIRVAIWTRRGRGGT